MDLQEFADKLIKEGFRVFFGREPHTYLFAADGNAIGYVQEQLGVGYKYTTVHKPSTSMGTGFMYMEGNLNVETMRDCCHCHTPAWYGNGAPSNRIEKYRSVESWLKDSRHLTEYIPE